MAGKSKDRGIQLKMPSATNRKCPRCFHHTRRLELAGDEREVVVADVCLNCGLEFSERVEVRRK